MFLLVIAGVVSYYTDETFSVVRYINLHIEMPLLWFFDLILIVTFIIIYIFIYGFKEKIKSLEDNYDIEQTKTSNVLHFVEKLKNDEFDVKYDSKDDDDVLKKSLVSLRDSLKENNEEQIERRKEDDQRNWIAEGLAKFGEILRNNIDNIDELSNQIISNLGLYVDAIQGNFFILNDNDDRDKFYELTSSFAYNRKKFSEKRIELGEGLVGRAAQEKSTIYMDEVPESYVEITSGLGESNPRSILITPLKMDDVVYGVIELASFNYFPKYQIDFIEKVAEIIASTISSVKISMRTSKLLEDSQEQAERLAQQEEEMRQNVEELQATQEEAAKQAEQFVSFTNSVNHTLIRAEYDINGTLLYANTKFLDKLGYENNSEVEGSHISIFINDKDKIWFNKIWETLAAGGRHFEGYMKHITKDGKDLWTMATYSCVREAGGNVEKVLFLAIDSTEQKKQSLDYERQVDVLNISCIKAEFTPNGKFIECNKQFLKAFDYKESELADKAILNFIKDSEEGAFEEEWNKILKGDILNDQLLMSNKNGADLWLYTTLSPINDMYGEITKVIMIAFNITDQKKMEFENRESAQKLIKLEHDFKSKDEELNQKIDEAKKNMRSQYKEMEHIKLRNEKTLEAIADAVITINKDGIIEFFNRAAENLWGFKKNEILGHESRELFHKDRKKHDEFVKKFINPEQRKIIGHREKVSITTKDEKDIKVNILLTEVKVDKEYSYTAFIQKV